MSALEVMRRRTGTLPTLSGAGWNLRGGVN